MGLRHGVEAAFAQMKEHRTAGAEAASVLQQARAELERVRTRADARDTHEMQAEGHVAALRTREGLLPASEASIRDAHRRVDELRRSAIQASRTAHRLPRSRGGA